MPVDRDAKAVPVDLVDRTLAAIAVVRLNDPEAQSGFSALMAAATRQGDDTLIDFDEYDFNAMHAVLSNANLLDLRKEWGTIFPWLSAMSAMQRIMLPYYFSKPAPYPITLQMVITEDKAEFTFGDEEGPDEAA